MVTRYNVYFNGKEALKGGVKKMDEKHKEDYTNLLPVFTSNVEQTRNMASSDMDYAIEKAVKAIDKHSITAKPRRKKNKESKSYETFRKQREFNKQMDKCYILLGKAYFYKKKYTMANNTFRFIQRQYPDDKEVMTEVDLWMFRCASEMGRYEEAARFMGSLESAELSKAQREMYDAAKTDYYIRQGLYSEAARACEQLVADCRSMKKKPRYNFILSQLYLKENQDAMAMTTLKKTIKFNFNYEMVFNAKINMALAYQAGDESVGRKLRKMLKDVKNEEFQDRIYYALANIEEKKGDEGAAIDLYWKSVQKSVSNDNQKSLSFFKLGEYYFKEREYVTAQSCYDSCMYFMDSRFEDYDRLKVLVGDLTNLVVNLNTIQTQDSLQNLAALPEGERNAVIDGVIQSIKDKEKEAKEREQREQSERNFYVRNDMISNNTGGAQASNGGEWYFYNPVTISLGKNDFKRKWGRRKQEDNWRRQNKAMVEFAEDKEELATEEGNEKENDTKSREYYTKNIPLKEEELAESKKKVEEAYYKAGEIYMYKFDDYEKSLDCFETFIRRFPESVNSPLAYYFAYDLANKLHDSEKAERYKNELLSKFPDSDFAKGLLDPEYFKKVDHQLKIVEKMYEQAHAKYRDVYYNEALIACEDILQKYPDNKLLPNVLFLKAMCLVNLQSDKEVRDALTAVLDARPGKEIKEVVNGILAAMDVGDKPVTYNYEDMAAARSMKASRNWKFDSLGMSLDKKDVAAKTFKAGEEKEKEHIVVFLMPEDMKTLQVVQAQARFGYINAAELINGKQYEAGKEELWYKKNAIAVKTFENGEKAVDYLNRIASDKVLLRLIGDRHYRMFAITADNFSMLKRLKNLDVYVDFFVENYFDHRQRGEMVTGQLGAAAHIFQYKEDEKHNFVLMVPFREINTKKIAALLTGLERAFTLERADYDNNFEFIVVKSVGTKSQALDYMNMVLKDKEIFDRLAGVEHEAFVITANNLDVLVENEYIEEYKKFFEENYLKGTGAAAAIGIEDGAFVYNKALEHRFVLLYSNKVDPFKLKTVFDEFNFAGLTMNNSKYNDDIDCMIVSGFSNRDEVMRYFNNIVDNRKLFKPLKGTDYRNFVITVDNLKILQEKQLIEEYLLFFKKYYLNNTK